MAAKRQIGSRAPVAPVKKVVQISSNILYGSCSLCGQAFDHRAGNQFVLQLNHFLSHPGVTLLHVGQETSEDHECKPWQATVAIVAVPNVPDFQHGRTGLITRKAKD
jgi:hypothetical protein